MLGKTFASTVLSALLLGDHGNMPNLIEYHILRLKDKNPEVRLKTIQELRLLGDPVAMPPLEEVFRTDPEPEVRKAAQEAGREIFLKQRAKS
jgi:HEAT repeat protein